MVELSLVAPVDQPRAKFARQPVRAKKNEENIQ
jgi:hypothetical protein